MADIEEGDEQDLAEAFDETHREGEDPYLFDAEDELDPDLDDRAYDATRAVGDEDEDAENYELSDDEFDDEDIDEEQEEDVEAGAAGGDLMADAPDDDDLVGSDERSKLRARADEAGLSLSDKDLDDVAPARNRQADKFESNGPLSDEQIADLGYGAKTEPRSFSKAHREDLIDEGLEESFPASDPPSTSASR